MKKEKFIDRHIILGNVKTKIIPLDLDGDGQTGGVEALSQQSNVIPVKETSELGDAITEFNKDDLSGDRLSSIDFRSRINNFEIAPMIALDSLIGMGFIPTKAGILNRVKMRKSVSLGGAGRKEFVDIVVGKTQRDSQIRTGQNLMGMGEVKK